MDRITVECVPSTHFFKGVLLSKRLIKVSVSHMGIFFANLKKESISRWRPNYWQDGVRGTAFDRAFMNEVATPVACTVETTMPLSIALRAALFEPGSGIYRRLLPVLNLLA
jgi:hypothetical protein